MMHLHIKWYRAIHVDSNQAYAIPDGWIHQNPYEYSYNDAYRMTSINRPTICPSLPSHTGNLEFPVWHCSDSNASYVKINGAADKCDEFCEKAGPKEEPIYEEVTWHIHWPKWEAAVCQK